MYKQQYFENIDEYLVWLNNNKGIVEVITKHEVKHEKIGGFTIVYYEPSNFK